MANFDFYTLAGASILAHPRAPSYPLDAAPVRNILSSTTVGGRVMSQVRGADRRRFVLRWRYISAAHLALFLSWHTTYGANRLPFKLELPADLTDLGGGSFLNVRSPARELDYRWTSYGHYDLDLELLEDLSSEAYITTLTGALTASGVACARFETYITPSVGSLAAAGIAPALRTPLAITPAVGALAAAGVAPTLS